jgi:hypothetical protein
MMRPENEHEALRGLAYAIHEEARLHTLGHSFIVGSVMRGCANRILWELGEGELPYEGPPPTEPPVLPASEGWTCQSCGADNFIPSGFVRDGSEVPS